MTGRIVIFSTIACALAAIVYGAWYHSQLNRLATEQQQATRELGEIRKLLEATSAKVGDLGIQIKKASEQMASAEKKADAQLSEASRKTDDLEKKVDKVTATSSDVNLAAQRALEASSLSLGGAAFLMDVVREPPPESKRPVSFSSVIPGNPKRGMKFDGAGGRDEMTVPNAGVFSIDGASVVSVERFNLANGHANDISILAPGLNQLEDDWLEIELDPKLDKIRLDACLEWKKGETAKGKTEWIAIDKDNQSRKVTLDAAAVVETGKACDNRYAFATTRREFPDEWYKQARQLEAQVKSDKEARGAPAAERAQVVRPRDIVSQRRSEEPQPYTPDDTGNILQYRKWMSALPTEAQKPLGILIGLMESGQMDTEFATNKVFIEPLGFDTDILEVKRVATGFDCKKDRYKGDRRGGQPLILVGDGMDISCGGLGHYVFSGDKNDRIEFGSWDFHVVAPGKGDDVIKGNQGGSITILGKGWGHKKFEQSCNYEEGQKREPAYVRGSPLEKFGGIGLKFTASSEGAKVVDVFKGEAAEKAGMVAGDVITAVDDKPLASLTTLEMSKFIRGKPETEVRLSVRSRNQSDIKSIVIRRKLLQVQTQRDSRQRIDYRPKYPHENYIVFGPGVSPQDMKEEPRGKWTNTKTGDTIEIPHCFNLVYADEPAEQAKTRIVALESATQKKIEDDKAKALAEPALQPLNDFKQGASEACSSPPEKAADILVRYPVIVEGTFNSNNEFVSSKVYKGFRTWPNVFARDSFSQVKIQPGKPALVVADYGKGGATTRCGKVLYETDSLGSQSYASILAEAAVYAADAMSRVERSVQKSDNRNDSYALSEFLKKNGDYLTVIELSTNVLRKEMERRQSKTDPYAQIRPRSSKKNTCGNTLSDSFMTQNMQTIVDAAKDQRGGGNDYGALRNLGEGLLRIGAYDEAMFILCGTGNDSLYVQAALKAGQRNVLNEMKLENIASLSDLDLSGLVFRRLGAGGTWKNVKVTGTDFTNANFGNTTFENVNLGDARVDFATYSCKTVFPEGFDPVAHHMIPQWRHQGCDHKAIPKVDISGVTAPSVSILDPEKDHEQLAAKRLEFWHLDLDGVKAQNAVLGYVRCSSCKIRNADFSNARIAFGDSDREAEFTDSSFRNADLRDSRMMSVTFTNVDFSGANLSGVSFEKAKLTNVNFTSANLEGARFERSQFDSSTKFPEGFNPESAGMLQMIK